MTTLDEINSISQIVAAIAVVGTLPFIAIQTRISRRIAEGDSYQSIVSSVNQFFSTLAITEGAADLYIRGRKDPTTLTDEERTRFFYASVQWFCFHENLYLQQSRKLLPKEYFEAWSEAFRHDLRDPGFVGYWQQERLDFALGFQNYVDEIMRSQGNDPLLQREPEDLLLPQLGVHTLTDPERPSQVEVTESENPQGE